MKLIFFLLIIANFLNAETTSPPNGNDVIDCISELPIECENLPLSECKLELTPICAECKEILPQECKDTPLSECNNPPPQCKNSSNTMTSEPQPTNDSQTTQLEPINETSQTSEPLAEDGTVVQEPHDCVHEIPIECENSPLSECQLELTPVCEECKAIMPPQCQDKPLSECNNPPPQCKMPPPPAGTQIAPPKADECSNENAGIYHPENLEANEGENKTTLDIPREDGGASGFEIDSEGNSVIGIKPPAEAPPLRVEAPPCAQVEMKEDGSFNQYFNTDEGVQAELNATANGNFELTLRPTNGKNVELKAPTGSNVIVKDDGSLDDYFSNDYLESELNISKSGDFELKLKPAKKPPSKLKAPPGAKMEMAEDGSFKNYIAHDNGIEHQLDSSNEGDFDFTFKHPNKKGFNFHMPSGSDIELQDNGAMKQILEKDTKRVEFDANENGNFETKLELQDKDINKTREFLGLDGSDINMGEEGNVTSTYFDYNNSLAYDIKIDENGTLIAKISKLVSQKNKRDYLDVSFYESEPIVSYEMSLDYFYGGLNIYSSDSNDNSYYRINNLTTNINIDANYTTDSNFSIEIDKDFIVTFTPLEASTFQEVTYLDSKKEINLLSGKCDVYIQKSNENLSLKALEYIFINSQGVYLKDNIQESKNTSFTLTEGWNLISIPIAGFIDSTKVGDNLIWTYNNQEWIKNPIFLKYKFGYWVLLEQSSSIEFNGYSYKNDLSNLKDGEWYLLGSGIDEENLKSNGFQKVFIFRDSKWQENPNIIKKGEGFWIKK